MHESGMTRKLKHLSLFICIYLLVQISSLHGHGFSALTVIQTSEGCYCFDQLAEVLPKAKVVCTVHGLTTDIGEMLDVPITHIWNLKKGAKPIEGARFLKWDHLHDEVEAYNSQGEHLGAVDPLTNLLYKPALGERML